MEIFFVIIGGLAFIVGTSLISYHSDGNSGTFGGLILLMIGELAVTLAIASKIRSNYPSALDVYQDKTTLEITYRDSIPIDSVVVFKNCTLK